MELPTRLVLSGGAVYLLLGSLHGLWSLADVWRPRRFAPDDRAVHRSMEQSTLRFSRGRTTMWDAWLGFNISHGLGAAVFGAFAILVSVYQEGLLAEPPVLAVMTAVSVIYLVLALRFWFYIPAIGIGVATACFTAALTWTLVAPQ